MTRVVYILGAGFSAPVGLPLVPNFLIKAKDLYFRDPEKYLLFEPVFRHIESLSPTLKYFASDLFNIEEILSLLEMDAHFGGSVTRAHFVSFIEQVVDAYTPTLSPPPHRYSNWVSGAFGKGELTAHFGYFVTELCGLKLRLQNVSGLGETIAAVPVAGATKYSIVTMNYDLLLERYNELLVEHYSAPQSHRLHGPAGVDNDGQGARIIKLHGSVGGDDIVPPTWSKGVHPEILPAWKAAYAELSQANHVRFIGYSLPENDSYFRYLLKSALPRAPHLKSVDALCLDPDGTVEARYRRFITFNYFRFKNMRTESYLAEHLKHSTAHGTAHVAGQLEVTHAGLFA